MQQRLVRFSPVGRNLYIYKHVRYLNPFHMNFILAIEEKKHVSMQEQSFMGIYIHERTWKHLGTAQRKNLLHAVLFLLF